MKLHPLRQAAGIGLLIAGVAGCLLPIIPGIPLLLAGVAILGTDHPLVKPAKAWLEKRGWWPQPKDEPKAEEPKEAEKDAEKNKDQPVV